MTGGTAWIAASDVGSAVGALIGTAIAGALWLAFALRSLRLRDEASPNYVGLYRWTGEQVRTRRRAVAFMLGWGIAVFVANLVILS